jgi:hypothetical protein
MVGSISPPTPLLTRAPLPRVSRLQLWLRWTTATLAGEVLGIGVIVALTTLFSRVAAGTWTMVVLIAAGSLAGAVLGACQWTAIGPHLPREKARWIAHTTAASAFTWTLGVFGSAAAQAPEATCTPVGVVLASVMPVGMLVGAAIGAAQWLILRRRYEDSGWWLLANTLGWALGTMSAFTWMVRCPQPESAAALAVLGTTAGLIAGLVTGGVTGLGLVAIVTRPKPAEL